MVLIYLILVRFQKKYIYNVLFYKVLYDFWGVWKIYFLKNILFKNNFKNDFFKKKLFFLDCVNGKYYLFE